MLWGWVDVLSLGWTATIGLRKILDFFSFLKHFTSWRVTSWVISATWAQTHWAATARCIESPRPWRWNISSLISSELGLSFVLRWLCFCIRRVTRSLNLVEGAHRFCHNLWFTHALLIDEVVAVWANRIFTIGFAQFSFSSPCVRHSAAWWERPNFTSRFETLSTDTLPERIAG